MKKTPITATTPPAPEGRISESLDTSENQLSVDVASEATVKDTTTQEAPSFTLPSASPAEAGDGEPTLTSDTQELRTETLSPMEAVAIPPYIGLEASETIEASASSSPEYTEAQIESIRHEAYEKGRNEALEEVRRARVAYYRNLREAGARAGGRMPDSRPDAQFLASPRQGFWE